MSFQRIIRRRQYISDHPPIFNRRQKEQTAFTRAMPKPQERINYHTWCIAKGLRPPGGISPSGTSNTGETDEQQNRKD